MQHDRLNRLSVLRQSLLKGAVVLSFGQVAAYGLAFLRSVILARLLTKADFGLATAFGIAVTLLELTSRMAFSRQIVQARNGDSPQYQATAHAFQMVFGLVSAVLLAMASFLFARLFDVPNHVWAFAALAFLPLIQGLEHLDVYRRQREMEYWPVTVTELVPQLIVALAAWPLAVWLGDFRVFLWLMLGKAVLSVIMSHAAAQRRYSWAWDSTHIHGMFKFGWPLLLNGALMFACQQGDHMVVGASFSLDALGGYAVAASVVSIPWLIFAKVVESLVLPVLAQVQDKPIEFRERYTSCLECAAIASAAITLPLIVAGDHIISLMYGDKYSGLAWIMVLLGSASGLRFLRQCVTVAAMAQSNTKIQMVANLFRAVSLPLALVAVALKFDMEAVALSAVIGEFVALGIAFGWFSRQLSLPLGTAAIPMLYLVICFAAGAGVVALGTPLWTELEVLLAYLGMLAAAILAARRVFRASSRDLWEAIRHLQNHGMSKLQDGWEAVRTVGF